MLSRLRAVLTPRMLVLFLSIMLAVMLLGGQREDGGETALESRISRTLSSMNGVGKVRVVILMRAASLQTNAGAYGRQNEQVPCGVVAVVEGADDPLLHAQITQALCALLGLPASAVSVVSGGG